jgi:hypothetical protein
LIELLKKSIEKSNWVPEKNINESTMSLIWKPYLGLLIWEIDLGLLIDELWTWKEYNYWDNICIELKWKKECWILSDRKKQNILPYKQIIWNFVVLVWLKEWTKFRFLSSFKSLTILKAWSHNWTLTDLIILKS